tara:strand:+ start:1241 stop:1342 length:102 start_codon:yes stop_codon:yes gene_type:complete
MDIGDTIPLDGGYGAHDGDKFYDITKENDPNSK